MNPSNPLRVVATQVSTAANAGAPHGAATMPDVAPSSNTAGYDPPDNPLAQATSRCGAATGNTSSIASPHSNNRFATARSTQRFEAIVPNSEPVRPAISPINA